MDKDEQYRMLAEKEAERKKNEYWQSEISRVEQERQRSNRNYKEAEKRKNEKREREAQERARKSAQKAANEKAIKEAKRNQQQIEKNARATKKAINKRVAPNGTPSESDDPLGILITLAGAGGSAYLANLQGGTGYALIIAAAIGGFVAYKARTIIKWIIGVAVLVGIIGFFAQSADASILATYLKF